MAETSHDQEVRLRLVERDNNDIKSYLKKLDGYFDAFVRIEEKQIGTGEAISRAFGEISKLDERVKPLELAFPGLKEVRGWIITGVLGILGLLGTAVLYLVIKLPI